MGIRVLLKRNVVENMLADRHMSKTELAERLKIHKQYLSMIFVHKRFLSPAMRRQFIAVLHPQSDGLIFKKIETRRPQMKRRIETGQ